MKAVLLGLEFSINNLGCEALSYSFVNELYNIAEAHGERLELTTVVFEDTRTPYIPGTDIEIRRVIIEYKSPSFWKKISRLFRECDYIFDFTMGDSFSDIYGMKRFVLDSMKKTVAIMSKTPYILGPQTYGPYKNLFVKRWAKWILQKAACVYTRDEQSLKMARELSGRDVVLTTDVAFALPYNRKEISANGKVKVGINPSGLLWMGGYTHDNQFSLTMDYQKYCWEVCERLNNDSRYQVFLIPHVGTLNNESNSLENHYENDGVICQAIQKKYPDMMVLDNVDTPMEAKSYIAAMDIFIGARMHATIGAFSSGVATIPVSYSRKFEGLYGSIDYDYIIHACGDTTEEAVEKTIGYIENYRVLQKKVEMSMEIVHKKQKFFRDHLSGFMFGNDC